MRVHEVMTKDVEVVRPDTPLRDVASLLAIREISGVPVVDDLVRVLGVVSESDVIRVAGGSERARRGFRMGRRYRRRTAGAEMTTPAVTIAPGATVADAAALMLDRRVNRLPVVEAGKLAGIVSRADLVRAFARDDGGIAREIKGDVVLRGIYVQPRDVDVSVRDGEVTLDGEVESRGKAERLVELARAVPGVVSVRSRVNWRVDKKAPKGIRVGRSR